LVPSQREGKEGRASCDQGRKNLVSEVLFPNQHISY
jgi:hypothetical protein